MYFLSIIFRKHKEQKDAAGVISECFITVVLSLVSGMGKYNKCNITVMWVLSFHLFYYGTSLLKLLMFNSYCQSSALH